MDKAGDHCCCLNGLHQFIYGENGFPRKAQPFADPTNFAVCFKCLSWLADLQDIGDTRMEKNRGWSPSQSQSQRSLLGKHWGRGAPTEAHVFITKQL